MAANLRFYTADGATLVTSITFSEVVPGTVSAAQTFRLVNDDSGGPVDQATNPFAFIMEREPVTDEPLLQGLRGVDERWVRFELTGVSSDDVDQIATGIEPVGRGRVLRTATLPSGGWVQLKVYYAPPSSVPPGAASTRRFVIGADDLPATVVDQGHSESDRDGVIAGIGDGLHTELVIGGTITASGTPDDKVNVPDLAWIHEGIPQVKLAHQVTLNANDSAAVALGSGESYWARLSVGAGAAITVTKSVKFTTAGADPDDVPAVPAGEIDLGYVLRDNTAAIDSADITSRAWAGRFELTWTSGLNVTLGGGWARVDNALVRRQARSILALAASQAEVSIWLVPDGGFTATNDGSKPDPRSYLLYTVPTGASDVTIASLVDRRDVIGSVPEFVPLTVTGTLTDGLAAHGVWPHPRDGYVVVPRGMPFRWHNAGSGNSAGITKADLKINGTTAFTSSGTLDRRPSIEHDTSPTLATAGLPEIVKIPAFALLSLEIDVTEAFNGTAPSGATLGLLIHPT